jgi:hypothetical protein
MRQPEGYNFGGGYFKTVAEARAAAEPVLAKKAEEARIRVIQHNPVVTDISEFEGKWHVTVEFTTTPDPATGMGERVIGEFALHGWGWAPKAIMERAFQGVLTASQVAAAKRRQSARDKKLRRASRLVLQPEPLSPRKLPSSPGRKSRS